MDEILQFDLFRQGCENMIPGPVVCTLKVVLVSLKQVPCESNGHILQNRRKPAFWPILDIFGAKTGPKIWLLGIHILQNSKNISNELKKVSCESSGNVLQNDETRILTQYWPYSGSKRARICGPGAIIYVSLKVLPIYLWNKFHGHMLKKLFAKMATNL